LDIKGLFAPTYLLILGSVLGKILDGSRKSESRTALQVLANGGIATLFILMNDYDRIHLPLVVILGLASFAISICDTISSEVGIALKGESYDILKMVKVEIGRSGGISIVGTSVGVVATTIYAVCCVWIFELEAIEGCIIIGVGVMGMLIDSIVGSKWQALYSDKSIFIETPKDGYTITKGSAWMDNDMVNILSNVMAIAITLIIGMIVGWIPV
jgi:uncharacterized membrane protein